MCGIAGWLGFDRDMRTENAVLDAMTATMSCRGPDDRGTWSDVHIGLGHHRLAIVDPPGGAQPMSLDTPEGPVVLVYSGEVYNHVALRDDLAARGHRFRTASDTEVVLHGYLEWGEAVAERLVGMFAFAVWDGRAATLVLVRDRLGIKPLTYARTPDGVVFGSEPKAVLANPLVEPVVTVEGMRELFAFVKTPGHAVWDGLREVPPGHVVTVDPTGQREYPYWRLETSEHTEDRDATVGRVRELLDDIVTHQLVADVPLGVLLSGGLDSSAITALAARRADPLRTFSVDFTGHSERFAADEIRATPDAPFIRDVVAHAGTEHRDIVLDPATLADPATRASLIRARDVPMGLGDMDISLYLLFSAISRHSTVALSGEGADEVFGGYPQFFCERARNAENFPWLTQFRGLFAEDGAILRRPFVDALDLDDYVRDAYRSAVSEVRFAPGESDVERRMRTMSHLHLTRFLPIMLDRKDRASMASGLEVRVPFCDHRLAGYVYNVPWALKTHDGHEKSLLRSATADLLPQSVVDRRKSYYPATQDPAYLVALQQQAGDLLGTKDHPVFDIVQPGWLRALVAAGGDAVTLPSRYRLENTLDLATWIDIYRPTLKWS